MSSLEFGGLGSLKSALTFAKGKVHFQSCRREYGDQESACRLESLDLVWPMGSIGPAWPSEHLSVLGSLGQSCASVRLNSSEAIDLGFLNLAWFLGFLMRNLAS